MKDRLSCKRNTSYYKKTFNSENEILTKSFCSTSATAAKSKDKNSGNTKRSQGVCLQTCFLFFFESKIIKLRKII